MFTYRRLYHVVGAAVTLAGASAFGQPQSVTATHETQDLDAWVELSRRARRSDWHPAVERLGRLAGTSDEMRAKVWSRARVNTLGMKFAEIEPGTFVMCPSPDPREEQWGQIAHRVRITRRFYLSVTEVTNAHMALVFPDHKPYTRTSPLPDTPAVNITWERAARFCELLSEREGVRYRLPTEAEREYACRAGTTTTFCCGDDPACLKEYAWYGRYYDDAARVASFKPNAWGIYDMHGNAAEWVSDWFRFDTYRLRATAEAVIQDPQGPPQGLFGHVLRSGYWAAWIPQAIASSKRLRMPMLPLWIEIFGDCSNVTEFM